MSKWAENEWSAFPAPFIVQLLVCTFCTVRKHCRMCSRMCLKKRIPPNNQQ